MREEASALIFGPQLSSAGARGTVAVSVTGVEMVAGSVSRRAPLDQVTLREVGFDKPGLEIAWRDTEGAWAAHVLEPTAATRLLATSALSSTTAAANLRKAGRKTARGRSIGRVVLLGLVLLPILFLVWFVLNASTFAGWVANRIPVEQEISMGREAFAGLSTSLKLRDEGPAYDAVQSIVATLTKDSRYRFDVHIAEDSTLNAFAMPGGVIVVHTGLIAATTRPEELAGVLAHEVQHVELRHSLRGLIKEMGLRGLWAFVTGDLGDTLAGKAALELTSLQFSRDDEREADARGFDALVKARIDPAGMPAFFKIMSQKMGDQTPGLLSTHPLSEDRERELRQRIDALGQDKFQPLPFPQWPPR